MISIVFSLGVLALYMCVLYVLSLITRNNGIADVGYGIAFMVLIGSLEFREPVSTWELSLLSSLPFIWGIRLALRIAAKNFGKPEDFRYKAWREAWKGNFLWRSFLQIYLLQGLVIATVASPVLISIAYPSTPYMPLFITGIIVWIVGFIFEVAGDRQLDNFIRDPANKGKIMMSGLWRFSRHPNYFGESTMWWGIAIAASGINALPYVGFVSPLLITFLLLKVSGVPLLEKRWEGNTEWKLYAQRTSVFIPLPPK